MAIVVVHGVNTRADASYAAWTQSISTFWQETIGPLQIDGVGVTGSPAFAYWGDQGVDFKWKMASLPSGDREQYGSQAMFNTGAQTLAVDALHEVFNRPMPEALGLLADLVALDPTVYKADDLALLMAALHTRHEEQPADPLFAELLQATEDDQTLGIIRDIVTPASHHETYGAITQAGLRGLGTLSSKLKNAAVHGASSLFLGNYRSAMHRRGATFLGDLMKYLHVRRIDGSSEIQRDVLAAINDSVAADSEGPLVLVGHSLGGVILFDLIASGLIDAASIVLVTVGSQISHFEEMNLLLDSDANYPNADYKKRPIPKSLIKWINFYDTNDIFAFVCTPVFEGVTDVEWSTGVGMFEAHGAYFFNPEFYSLIKEKLQS